MNANTKLETITPDKAASYLEHNKRNRKLNQETVRLYANDMRNGNWLLNHQGIAFDDNGNLVDGQHRLEAIILSKSSVSMFVTRGLSSEQRNGVVVNIMDTVDRGRVRGIGQQLGLFHGITNGNRVAAVCTSIAHFFLSSGIKVSTSQVLHVLKIYQPDIEKIYSLPDSGKFIPSYIGAVLVIFHNCEPQLAIEFAGQYLGLEGATISPQVRALKTWLSHHPNAAHMKDDTMKVVSSCLFNFKEKRAITKVYASDTAANWIIGLQKANSRKILEIINSKQAP